MIQNNPPLYSTTYFGHHTCQLHQAYATFPRDTSDPQDSHMIRFDHPDSSIHQHQNQSQNQIIYLKDENMMMLPDKSEEWSSPSQWMSSEVAHAVEAFGFNPSRTSSDLSWPLTSFPSLSSYICSFVNYMFPPTIRYSILATLTFSRYTFLSTCVHHLKLLFLVNTY